MSEKVFFVLGVSDIFGTFVRKLKDVYEKNGLLYRVFVVVVDGGGGRALNRRTEIKIR
ncbi:MAG: hypothetical protein RSA98_04950 [Odoribacter sp.]